MLKMDGYEVLKQLRKMESLAQTSVVAVSSNTMKEDQQRAILAGFSQYITKPVDINQIYSLIKATFELEDI